MTARVLRGIAVAAVVVMLAACQPSSGTPAETTPASAAAPDQSAVFFPGPADSYGVTVDQTDREHLAQLYALRQIDPCGFVAAEAFPDRTQPALHGDYSYTYNSVPALVIRADRRRTLGGNACAVAFPDSKTGLLLTVYPGDPGGYTGPAPFTPDPEHPGVTKTTSWGKCTYRVRLPLTAMAGAPASMQDPMLQLAPMTDGRWDLGDTTRCDLAGALAGDAAAQVRDSGIPVLAEQNSVAARYLSSDPCAAAAELSGRELTWSDPKPQSQWPTTWRHPGTCELRLSGQGGAVIRRGLGAWPQLADGVVDPATGERAVRREHHGVTVFGFSGDDGCGSFALAKAADALPVVDVGSGAPGLSAPTPIVVVEVFGRCSDRIADSAVAAIKRGTR